jgi:hypothetical protein
LRNKELTANSTARHPNFPSSFIGLQRGKTASSGDNVISVVPARGRPPAFPIVTGEVGTGPHGLCHTVPPALTKFRGAIVYGHGVFTVGTIDFNDAFRALLEIENACWKEYFASL